ncbi:PfaB family protein [Shewanella litorisediminis]|uniref:PfaB family protein n=1 Tax=Shewanella litorisediminis TaxID=1173586 RepID=A0ABX7G690_9GAMM|nr:PfaB family protein [Shewanella litorisediminis]MCL2916986.1 PfaB family protein [Shewanella litorisediminis]QRH02856.1 PfaB family protein [Shewanella litorisediminis]
MSVKTPPLRLALCRVQRCPADALRVTANEPDWHALIDKAQKGATIALGKDGTLLMLPALEAAKQRLHPLALLQALGSGKNAIHTALAQAGRAPADAEILFEQITLECVIRHAEQLASRTHPVYGSYWSHPRYQARVVALVNTPAQSSNEQPSNDQSNADETSSKMAGGETLVLTQGSARLTLGLNGPESAPTSPNTQGQNALPWLLPLALPSADWSHIQRRLTQVQASLNALKDDSVKGRAALAKLIADAFDEMTPGCRALVLVGDSAKALAAEAAALSWRIAESLRDDIELVTPAGSVFAPSPATADGLAFVYPGVGVASASMLSSLHLRFADSFDALDQESREHGLDGLNALLQPRELEDNPSLAEQAVAGVGASYLMARVLMTELGIKPALALGYSMGEAAMVASHGLWQDPFAMAQDTLSSELFNEQISGELKAVRALWQLDEETVDDNPAPKATKSRSRKKAAASSALKWQSAVVRLSAEEIRPHLADFPRVSIAIAQGPSTVLAGDETELKRLCKTLGKRPLTTGLVTAMHTPAAAAIKSQLQAFYLRPLAALSGEARAALPVMLSAGADAPLLFADKPQTDTVSEAVSDAVSDAVSRAIAEAVATTFSEPLDFTALVLRAAKAGARLFVEVGAGRQTSGIIQAIADARLMRLSAHPCDGQDGKALQKTLARLIAHSIPMNLSRLRPATADAPRTAQETTP